MGAFKESMKQLADNLRALAGPSNFDVIADQLTIRTRTWSGSSGLRGDAPSTDVDVVVAQIYKIQQVSTEEVLSSAGKYEQGDLRVGPITPSWTVGNKSGGYSPAQLNPTGAENVEIIYVIAGTHAGNYQMVADETWKRFSFFVVLRRRFDTP